MNIPPHDCSDSKNRTLPQKNPNLTRKTPQIQPLSRKQIQCRLFPYLQHGSHCNIHPNNKQKLPSFSPNFNRQTPPPKELKGVWYWTKITDQNSTPPRQISIHNIYKIPLKPSILSRKTVNKTDLFIQFTHKNTYIACIEQNPISRMGSRYKLLCCT